MRILIIDNTIDRSSWGAADLRRHSRPGQGAIVEVRRAPQEDLPRSPRPYDRIVLSGSRTSALEDSPWVSRLHEFIRSAVDLNKPFLGICYGHQSLVRAIGGKERVRKGAVPEFGWSEIELVEKSALTRGLPPSFHTFSSHFEEVASLPEGFRNLARSRDCEIQACELVGKPVFGVQFHPERDAAGAKESLAERKRLGVPKVLLNPDKSDKLHDPLIAETIFRNFFSL